MLTKQINISIFIFLPTKQYISLFQARYNVWILLCILYSMLCSYVFSRLYGSWYLSLGLLKSSAYSYFYLAIQYSKWRAAAHCYKLVLDQKWDDRNPCNTFPYHLCNNPAVYSDKSFHI